MTNQSIGYKRKRYIWIDAVKIFACFLVVFGHLYMSMMSGGWIQESKIYYCWPVQTIYTFHVPLFFLCSGFLYQCTSKEWTLQEHRKNIQKKFLALGVPYFTFSLITLILKVVFSAEVNNQATPILKTLFIAPIAPYWYLYTLFFLFCFIPRFNDKKALRSCFVITIVLKLIYIIFLHTFNLPDIVSKVLANAIWFVMGMILTKSEIVKTKGKSLSCMILFVIGISISYLFYKAPRNIAYIQFLVGICFVIPIIYFFIIKCENYKTLNMNKLGKYFMPVYVLHTIVAAMFRSVLLKIGIHSFIVHFFVGLIVSIMIPVVIYNLAEKKWFLLFWFEPMKALKMKRGNNENYRIS